MYHCLQFFSTVVGPRAVLLNQEVVVAFGVSLTKVTRDVEVQVLCKIILSVNMTHLSFCDMTLSPIPGRMLERLNEKYQTGTLLLRQTLQLFVLTWVVVLVANIIPFQITKLYRNQSHCQ